MCGYGKIEFESRHLAHQVRERMSKSKRNSGIKLNVYRCLLCKKYHIGTNPPIKDFEELKHEKY